MADDKKKMFRADSPSNPFQTYDKNFKANMQQPFSVFSASPVAGAQEAQKRREDSNKDPQAVSLPPHLFIPADSQSIDISALANVPPATTVSLLNFTGKKGGVTYFIGYAIFNDALNLSLIDLEPTVNNARVLPLHGNPQLGFKLGLGLGADMSVLIPVQLVLQPGDVLNWQFTNNDVVDIAAGVRMSGYFSQDVIRKTLRFGG